MLGITMPYWLALTKTFMIQQKKHLTAPMIYFEIHLKMAFLGRCFKYLPGHQKSHFHDVIGVYLTEFTEKELATTRSTRCLDFAK